MSWYSVENGTPSALNVRVAGTIGTVFIARFRLSALRLARPLAQPAQQTLARVGEAAVGEHRRAHAGESVVQLAGLLGRGDRASEGLALDMDREDRLPPLGHRDEGLALGAKVRVRCERLARGVGGCGPRRGVDAS